MRTKIAGPALAALLITAFSIGLPGYTQAEEASGDGTVKVLKCPHCDFAVMKDCPLCGAKLEEKAMTAEEAQRVIDKAKIAMRGRA